MDADRRNRIGAYLSAEKDNDPHMVIIRELLDEIDDQPALMGVREDNRRLNRRIDQLEEELTAVQREKAQIVAQLEGVQPSLEQAHKDDVARQEEILRLRSLNDTLGGTIQPLRDHVTELSARVVDNQRRAFEAEKQVDDLRHEKAELAERLAEYESPRKMRPKG